MTHFNTTKFNLSYKGIPKTYPSGDNIPRSVRLNIAKEIQRIKENKAKYKVICNDNIIASFENESDAQAYVQEKYPNDKTVKIATHTERFINNENKDEDKEDNSALMHSMSFR